MYGTDNDSDGSHRDLTWRPPTAGGKKVQLPGPQRRDASPMSRSNSVPPATRSSSLASSGNADRRGSVQALLNQLNTFATDVHDTHDIDLDELKKEVAESLEMIKDMMEVENHGRKEGDAALQKRCDALEKALAQQRPSESDKKRLDHLENMFAAWADKNTRDVESMRRAQESLSKELASFNAAHEQHLEVEQSLDTAVKGLTSAAEQTAKALAAAKSKLDHLHENVLSCEQHCTATEHRSTLVAESVKSVETRISVTNEKVESKISKLTKEIETVKSELGSFSDQVKQKLSDTQQINQHVASQIGRLDPLEKGHSDLLARHDGQSRDLKGLKDDHKKRSQELSSLRKRVDDGLGDLADSTARELKATRKDLDRLRASTEQQNESKSTKAKIESLEVSVTTCEKHVTSVEKHLMETEKRFEGSIRDCSKDLESIKGAHGDLTQHVHQRLADANDRFEKQQRANSETEKRLEGNIRGFSKNLESIKGDHGDLTQHLTQHVNQRLADAHDRFEKQQKANADAHDGRHIDLLSKCDGQARDIQNLRQHIDGAINDLLQNTAREIKATRDDVNHLKASHDEVGPAIRSKIEHVQETVNGYERRVTIVETKVQETERRLETNVRHWQDETGKHNQDLGSLRQDLNKETAKRGQDVNNLRQHLDGALGDISHNTAMQIKASREDLDQVLALLTGVQRAWRARQKRISDAGGSRGGSRDSSPKKLCSEELNSPTSSKVAYKPLVEQKSGTRRSSCLL